MRKTTILILILALLCGMTAAQAAGGSIKLTGNTVAADGTVSVKVSVSGDVSGDTMAIRFSYDKTQLEIVKNNCSWIPKGLLQDINTIRGEGVWAGSETKKLDGDVCVLTFRVRSMEKFTSAKIDCTLSVKDGSAQVGEYSASVEVQKECSHTYGEWTSQKSVGHSRSCTLCGQGQLQSHEWDEGTVKPDPANPSRNIRTRKCTVCGETREEYENAESTDTRPEHTMPGDTTPETTTPPPMTRPEPSSEQTYPHATKPTEQRPEPTSPTENRPEATKPTETRPESVKPTESHPGSEKPIETRPEPTSPTEIRPEPTFPTEDRPEPTYPTENSPEPTAPGPENPPAPSTPQSGQINPGAQPEQNPQNPGQSGNGQQGTIQKPTQPEQKPQNPGQSGNTQQGGTQNPSQTEKPSGNTPQQGVIGPGVTNQQPETNGDHNHEQEQISGEIHEDHIHMPNGETVPVVIPAPGEPDTTMPQAATEPHVHTEETEDKPVANVGLLLALVLVWAAAGVGYGLYLRKRKSK